MRILLYVTLSGIFIRLEQPFSLLSHISLRSVPSLRYSPLQNSAGENVRLLALAEDRSDAGSTSTSTAGALAGPGKHKFVMWLAEERRKREQAEQKLYDVQEELARSEASRREATSRWLEAATIIGGAPLQVREKKRGWTS